MDKITQISAVIIIKNGEKTIAATLESLKAFQEVIIYDNGSTDNTKEILGTFPNVKLVEGDFLGFGSTKNKAASYSSNDWIFSLDADEVPDADMLNFLNSFSPDTSSVYEIIRTNYYKEYEIKHCGWKAERILRLYNKRTTAFNDNMVHEKILPKELQIQTIEGRLKHYPYTSPSDFIQKADHYSNLFAKENVGKRRSSPSKAFFNGLYSFFRSYILKKGILDGYPGLLISFSHMCVNFYKYLKLYEANKEQEMH